MENWSTIFVHYNGQFDEAYNYIGGQERLLYLPIANISIISLRSNIQLIFDAENIVGEYNMYYTSQSRSGRVVLSLLATDFELQRLCSLNLEANIYIIMNNNIGNTGVGSSQHQPSLSPSPSPYRPFMSTFSPPPYTHFSPTLEDLQRFDSSMYFDLGSQGGGSQGGGSQGGVTSSRIPDLNNEPEDEHAHDEEANAIPETEEAGVVVSDDDDDETSLDEDSSESESDDENFQMNCTVAEFSAWIRSAGGMSAFLSNLMPIHPLPDGGEIQSDLNNWFIPIIPVDTTDSPVVRDVSAILDQELTQGSMFWTKDDLFVAVGLWHMEQRQEFKVNRSDSTRVEYVCKRAESCTFNIRATCRGGCWIVRKFKPTHNCGLNLAGIGSRNVRSKAVAAYFARRMRREGAITKPRVIMTELQRSFGIRTSYAVALRARNAAISMLYGSIVDSFKLLPKYLEVLAQYNPGTVTDLDLAPDGTFRRCFVALGVSRCAFAVNLLRQVIVVDATHLKGRNKGILLVAVTKDGNEQVFPLALGVGPIENDETWKWFMSRLRMSFGCNDQLLIVSDQHISIANAVSTVYPGTAHGICFYHLQNKLTGYGRGIVKLYHRAAYAYRLSSFKQAMDKMQQENSSAYNKLITIGPERWAKSMCPVRRYSFLTSNAAEVFNARLLDARRLPVCSIIDSYRAIVEKWFDERRAKAQRRDDELTEEAVQKIAPLVEISHTHTVVAISQTEFKVNDGSRIWKVDLDAQTCECREFQLDLIPCSHAAAAIRSIGANLYDYINSYYKTSTWREIYGGSVNSLPPQHEWVVSPEAAAVIVLPPSITRQAGRPRNSRRPSGAEHSQASSSRQRARKRCSVCRSEGHSKRTCPERVTNND